MTHYALYINIFYSIVLDQWDFTVGGATHQNTTEIKIRKMPLLVHIASKGWLGKNSKKEYEG